MRWGSTCYILSSHIYLLSIHPIFMIVSRVARHSSPRTHQLTWSEFETHWQIYLHHQNKQFPFHCWISSTKRVTCIVDIPLGPITSIPEKTASSALHGVSPTSVKEQLKFCFLDLKGIITKYRRRLGFFFPCDMRGAPGITPKRVEWWRPPRDNRTIK